MPEKSDTSRLERICEVLLRHGVHFIVIGGQAEYIFGSPRVTFDVDLCYERSESNFESLAAALREINPQLRGAPPGLPFRVDARSLALGCNFTLMSTLGDLDLLGHVEPLGDYARLAQRAVTFRIGDNDVRVIDLDDLIEIKQHIHRAKDQSSLVHLLAIKRMREEAGRA